jgi:hypothetical protein
MTDTENSQQTPDAGTGPGTEPDPDAAGSGSILDRGGVDTDARAGRSLGIDFDGPPVGMTAEQVQEERERRLDPANRPAGAEVDNTGRTFDTERGEFTDSEQ